MWYFAVFLISSVLPGDEATMLQTRFVRSGSSPSSVQTSRDVLYCAATCLTSRDLLGACCYGYSTSAEGGCELHQGNILPLGAADYTYDWVTFLRRQDGSVDFHRGWADYKTGFGERYADFWLGLDTLHRLTSCRPHHLRVEMVSYDGEALHADYSTFSVGDAASEYRLRVAGYQESSTAPDAVTVDISWASNMNGMSFTTYDRDNDMYTTNCADMFTGGWWFNSCLAAHPTGKYETNPANFDWEGIQWLHSASQTPSNPQIYTVWKIKPV